MPQPSIAAAPSVEAIRERIRTLYRTSPRIRISAAAAHSKVVQDSEVTITGVYPHVFCVEELIGGTPQRHTFQYADIITRRIMISGMD